MGEIRENKKQWLIFRNRERAKGRKPRKKGRDAGGFRTPLSPLPSLTFQSKSKQTNSLRVHNTLARAIIQKDSWKPIHSRNKFL